MTTAIAAAGIGLAGALAEKLLPAFLEAIAAPSDAPPEAAVAVAKDKAATAAAEIEGVVQGHLALLAQDAAQPDLFRAGWRPFFGWVAGAGAAYELLLRPLLTPLAAAAGLAPLPPIGGDVLWPLVFGLLGLGTLRTVEKAKGVDGAAGAAIGKAAGDLAGGLIRKAVKR